MKNKKLFAILTLVCFMFTLMPVAAFAADNTLVLTQEDDGVYATATLDTNCKVVFNTGFTGAVDTDWTGFTSPNKIGVEGFNPNGSGYIAIVDTKGTTEATDDVVVLKENVTAGMVSKYTAGSADSADYQMSSILNAEDRETFLLENVDGTVPGESVTFIVNAKDAAGNKSDFVDGEFYVWAVDENGNISSALTIGGSDFTTCAVNHVYKAETTTNVYDGYTLEVSFARDGEYTVYAGVKNVTSTVEKIADINKLVGAKADTITVKTTSANPETFRAALDKNADKAVDSVLGQIALNANNVISDKHVVTFTNASGSALKGKTVTIDTNSAAIVVNKDTATTDSLGQIEFKVSASIEGVYEITFTVDGESWTVEVVVGSTAAAYIETVTEPAAPQAQYGTMDNDVVEFEITDINGNIVDAITDGGMQGIDNNNIAKVVDTANRDVTMEGKYIVLTEKPADSNLDSEDLYLTYADGVWGLNGVTKDVEGTYSVKVILDNGAYATATWEVKKFQTPVMLIIGASTDVIELGAAINGELKYVDANGVVKDAKDADVAATGYAVQTLDETYLASAGSFKLVAKDDEKYVGSTITVTAVSEKYNLVAVKDFTVADGAKDIAFVDKTADVNVNNVIEWNVVDTNGTRVALVADTTVGVDTDIKYVVLDKPEDAKVSVSDRTVVKDLRNKGIGQMALTSNKVGNVTVQVVVKAVFDNQVKYYTGTQVFAVGTEGTGDVVVMSIGSNEIIVNDTVKALDVAPFIQNNRTFVPFRALAEAFGADVAYDEATQAVTAELNGVTVVMTVGSAEYTVNGEAKTADVAPFIVDGRTMVPVRFAAVAFGINPIVTTNPADGTTADILFVL